jgi:hypothetical protein
VDIVPTFAIWYHVAVGNTSHSGSLSSSADNMEANAAWSQVLF